MKRLNLILLLSAVTVALAFVISCKEDGYLFIETGLAVMLTYDKEKDRIHLSPGGEYKRSNHQLNK